MSDGAASGATANRAPALPAVLTTPAFCDEGLILGAHTRLSSCDPRDDRIHALLTIAYGETLAPTAPETIAKAAIHWQRGDLALANLHLAFCRFPKLDELAVLRLQLAEWCLEQCLTPTELLDELGHRRPPLDKYGYDPAELRDQRGRWRRGDEIDVAANAADPFPDPIKENASGPLEQQDELHPRHLFPPVDPFHLVLMPPKPAAEAAAWAADIKAGVSAIAKKAAQAVPPGSGPVYGTAVHTRMKKEIKDLAVPGLDAEQSYKRGEAVKHGTPGSIRLDVVIGPAESPNMIGDLKTGSASLTSRRINEIREHLPDESKNVEIFQVRP